LASEKVLSPDRLILELAVKVIISVIIKYCSHVSHEVSQVLVIRLAAQRLLELIRSLRTRERETMLVGHVPSDGKCLPSMKLKLLSVLA
jgi:hypothetical protein